MKNITRAINSDDTTNLNDMSMGSEHPGGCQFARVDGSVGFISETVDMRAYKATASMNGDEPETLD